MSSKHNLEMKRTTAAVDAYLGNKFCQYCRRFKSILNGSLYLSAKGSRKMWKCSDCLKRNS